MRLPFSVVRAVARFQLRMLYREPQNLLVLATTPLLSASLAGLFMSSNPEMLAVAITAPSLMALFQLALFVAGEIVNNDREMGTLELNLAAPTPLGLLISARVGIVTLVSTLAFAESYIVTSLVYGRPYEIPHPWLFIATILGTVPGTVAVGVIVALALVRARSVRLFQNSIPYPFFLLSGILVPIGYLPSWVAPISDLIYLSWSARLFSTATGIHAARDEDPLQNLLGLTLTTLALSCVAYAMVRLTTKNIRRSAAGVI